MAKTSVTRAYRGKAPEPVAWEALARIFDALLGKEARSLPKYPSVIGAFHAKWSDAEKVEYEATSLDEIRAAYEGLKTASVTFSGLTQTREINFHYRPPEAEASVVVIAPDALTAERLVKSVSEEFPLVDLIERYVFISYDTNEFPLAEFLAKVVEKRMNPGISVFVAKRDIQPGANPLKVMLEDKLLRAEALLALCSVRSKMSPWLWWESSAVWAKGGLVIPLFVDISPGEFDGPITLVCQGRLLFDKAELSSALTSLVKSLCPDRQFERLTEEEFATLQGFRHDRR